MGIVTGFNSTGCWLTFSPDGTLLNDDREFVPAAEIGELIKFLQEHAPKVASPKLDDGWIEWKGGKCPVADGTEVEVRFRNGTSYVSDDPENLMWSNGDAFDDIVAYRVVTE